MRDSATLIDRLREHAGLDPHRRAVTFVGDDGTQSTLTYGELETQSRKIAEGLTARFECGSRVLVMLPNGLDFVIALVACFRGGFIAVPMPLPGRFARQWERSSVVARDAAATAIVTAAAHHDEVANWAGRECDPAVELFRIDGCEPAAVACAESAPPRPTDVAFLQYTSGSTSAPKGVVVTHANLTAHARASSRALGLDGDDVFCSWLPIHHDFGLIGMLLVPLHLGATAYLMSPTDFVKRPARWLQLLSRVRATLTAGPNFGYRHCCDRVRSEQLDGVDLSALRYALNASEPVEADTLDAFADRFAPYGLREGAAAPAYGLAEATLGVTYPGGAGHGPASTPLVDLEELARGRVVRATQATGATRRLVGCGVPHGVEVRIVDDRGDSATDGVVGEVWLRGETVAAGYWNQETQTNATFLARLADGSGPWLRTGDLGAMIDDQLYLTGRIKELLIVNGRNLYPVDLERALQQQHPGLDGRPAAVFAVGSDVVAVLECSPSLVTAPGSAAQLLSALAQTLAETTGASVGDIVLTAPGSVSRTTSGKVQRSRTRSRLADGSLTPLATFRGSPRQARASMVASAGAASRPATTSHASERST
ncbi:fatty acyl-AMP ligase [Pseudoclavibacter sp. AY1F1]|uniref:fatty acyl-AMP ligase n=1 Tax=Pseudoclavibacter sp. AY1F1 TaxID=2080583 RepID=UPI0015E2BF6D|nr:fatty acyl-AMP ligase [Pseudoclavibacter sp. AY1F1]